MLNFMRENKGHWILKVLLGLVAVSMVGYLGSYFFDYGGPQDTGDWAARVNGEAIAVRAFTQEARRLDSGYRDMFGQQYEQLKGSLQLGTQAVGSLVERTIILKEAARLGLKASDGEIARAITEAPDLRGPDGVFVGRDRYVEVLNRQFPGGAVAFERSVAEDLVVQKWRNLVTEPAFVTDAELEREYRARTDKTAIAYAIVPSASIGVSTVVDDAEAQAWYDAHREDFLRGESRKIRWLVVPRQAQLDKVQVTDAELQAFYDENADRFRHPEQRRASHILIRVSPDAPSAEREAARQKIDGILARAKAGEDFAALATASSQDPVSAAQGGDLGYFGRGQMVPAFEEAAFATPEGAISGVVETQFGYHILKVTGARAAGTVPLDEVREEIQRQVAARKAQEQLRVEADRIAAGVTGATELQAVATRESLEVGSALAGADSPLADLGPSPELRDAITKLSAGSVTPPLGSAKGLAIVACDEVVPPAVAPFAEVRDQVRTALLNDRARKAAVATARAALAGHPDLEAAAKTLNVAALTADGLAPGRVSITGTGGSSPELEAALFGATAKDGATGVVPVPAGALAYRITSRTTFDPEGFEASKTSLRGELLERKRTALLRSVLAGLESRYQVEVNQELVSRYNG